ncbi:hypothetical protein WMF31_24160 [Sorangium sp. So ce1036]|uniref:hypothetical protein n=1 Tax=Sorangium sp. So ce1036 TaxID=3133328 RepID=UPI003EFFB265
MTALASLLGAGSAAASDWHPAKPGSPAASPAARGAAAAAGAASARGAAEAYLKRAAAELRLEGVSLRYRNELPVGEHRTVRFSQAHDGLPVLGAAAAVHVTPENRVKVVVLDVARDLMVPTAPKTTEEAARRAVEARFGMTLAERPSAGLAVLPEEETGGKLVWVVDVRSARGGERYLVNAHTGEVVHRRPLAVDVLGRVYPISSAVTPELQDLELLDLDAASPQTLSGWDGNIKVVNYVGGDFVSDPLVLEQRVVPNAGQDFLYDPPRSASDARDEFAQVGIYYHLTRMRDYFASVHQLDMGTPGWKLVAVANMLNAGQPLDNAFFSPQGVGAPFSAPNLIGIGQGTFFDFSDDSDVFLHEFTHYVSANAIGYNEGQFAMTDYGISPWGGSIDEGIADYFACTVNDDSTLGEATLALFGMQRELSNDVKRCPDDLTGEVHEDGEIIGSLAWSLRDRFGEEVSDRLVWGALTMLTPSASFDDLARGLRTTADDLVSTGELTAEDAAVVEELLRSRGLDDCEEVLDLSGGKARRTQMFGLDLVGAGYGVSCSALGKEISLQSFFHFKSTPPPDAKGIRFDVQLQAPLGGDLDWNIYVRAGRHVAFTSTGSLPEATSYDYSVKELAAGQGEIVIDETSDPPFDPAQTYFLAIGHKNCPDTVVTVKSTDLGVEPPPPPPPVDEPAGPTEPETGASGGATPEPSYPRLKPRAAGCACRAAEPSAPVAPWAALSGLALAGAAVLRRRGRADS